MPIFEYKCNDCGNKFEFYHRGSETPECPACGSKKLSKLLSRFCACVKGGRSSGGSATLGGGSSCAGCSGGNCATCK